MRLLPIVNYAFNYVIHTCNKMNIDESHALRHSMDVFHFANKIYDSEIVENPFLQNQKNIIMCSAILHDMCDKKYMNETQGIDAMNTYMKDFVSYNEVDAMNKIISSMSYSTVKKHGYPELNEYNLAYHIVRESDLLAAYDVERCVIYQMMREKYDYVDSLKSAKELFHKRMFKYIDEQLFVTQYSKELSKQLHYDALKKLSELDKIYNDLQY